MIRIEMKNIAVKLLVAALLCSTASAALLAPARAQAPVAIATSAPTTVPEDPAHKLSKAVQEERDLAVTQARSGQYDTALTTLSKLHEKYPEHVGLACDYLAVLSWAGHDEEATRVYESVPADEPDYVLSAVGHSYRIQHQSEKALAAYRLGEQKYPDDVLFVDGEIRTLMDQDKLDDANKRADDDLRVHGNRTEIVAAKADVVQLMIKETRSKAVEMARSGDYAGSLALFRGELLDADHTTDAGIRADYLAVLGWAGKNDDKVIAVYKTLPQGDHEDFVLEATAKAYRNKHQYADALTLYRQGMRQYPDNTAFAIGEIRSLIDLGRYDEATQRIKAYEKAHGPSVELDSAKRDIEQARFNAVRRKAAVLARKGQFDQALAILRKLGGEHTKNVGILRDRLAITGWMGGHDQDVIDQYNALHSPTQPDYVLEAVAKAYRNLGKTDEALAIYEHGLKAYPKNEEFAVGTIRTLTDEGYIEKALNVANDNLQRYGNRLDVLIAAGDAANQYNQTDALRYYQIAATIAPKNPDVLRGLIRTSDRMGAPEVALQTIQENPGVVSDAERRQIEGDEAASLVRLGMLQQETDKKAPYAGTDRALQRIDERIAQWQGEGPEAQTNITRARFDRIIALHNRMRMREAASEYESLQAEGAEPPVFVIGAAGDAYMELHEPEKARDAYLRLLQIEPKNHLARRQLFYAYVDLGEYKNAYRVVDDMVSDGTIWNREKNQDVPMTDAEHRDAELTKGAARLYFGEISEADKILLPVIAQNMDSPAAHEELGNLDNAHQLPRAALEQYQIGKEMAGGESLSNEVGIANTQLALHNYPEAGAQVQSLMERYSDNQSVLRANRDWSVHNMAEIDLSAGYYFQPETTHNISGGQAFGVDAKIYSAPFNDYWRIFAGQYFTQQKEPDNEGSVGFWRSTAGVNYRNGDVTADLAPTYNTFHNTERVGVAGDASYAFNDHWSMAGSGELMSRDTPLRAMNHGVTADSVNARATWQQDESRSVTMGAGVMPFSDSNVRTDVNADYMERVWTRPFWKIDAIVSAGMDFNSEDENRSYFNPKSDLIGLFGARAIQTLYQRYSTMWQHSLQITPGFYAQTHYGTDPMVRARYEHRVFFNETFEAGLGFNFARQDYDGVAENDYSLTLDLVDHF